jgi:type V secretory pathway adhesin AidA
MRGCGACGGKASISSSVVGTWGGLAAVAKGAGLDVAVGVTLGASVSTLIDGVAVGGGCGVAGAEPRGGSFVGIAVGAGVRIGATKDDADLNHLVTSSRKT